MEDALGPVAPNITKVRELISSFEACHHKAERWVHNIIEAIGRGATEKGMGARPAGRRHPAEKTWRDACAALSAWCAGRPAASVPTDIGGVPASRMLAALGDSFWRATVRTMIHDTASGEEAELSLGLAIDMLWPCHWGFVDNLQIVLEAIGGRLRPEAPFAACGRNIELSPIRRRMEIISNSLRAFCSSTPSDNETDAGVLSLLGSPTKAKRWLAASLDKTLRLQMSPSAEMRAISDLAGPDWIRE